MSLPPRRTTRMRSVRRTAPVAARPAAPTDTRRTSQRTGAQPVQRNQNTMIVAVSIGAAVLLLVAIVAFSGGSKSKPKPKKSEAPAVRLDPSGHIREAVARGDAGLRKGREAVSAYERSRAALSESDRQRIVSMLTDANAELESAVAHLERALEMSPAGANFGVDEKRYIEMRKEIRRHLSELKR
jgi:hypothetical protein